MAFRIGGIASGFDTETMVRDLMKVERLPLDRLLQKKQTLQWQRDDYRAMNKLLNDFYNKISDGIYRQSSFTKKVVTSSNEAAVSVKNINSTTNVNTSIRVDQLAEAAYLNSAGDIRKVGATFDPNAVLDTERANLATDFTSTTFSIQAIKADGTLGDLVEISFDSSVDTLNSVISKINSSSAGVSAFYDNQSGRVSFLAKNTGDVNGQAEIAVTGDFLKGSLGLADNNILAGVNGKEGLNARFNINGIDTERYSNTFQISGFEYTLKQETTTNVSISSTNDTDSIYNSIHDFVNKYNEMIDKVNSKLSEERFRGFPPLTDEQKRELSDREVELWEEKAMSGLLRNDSILSSGLTKLRSDIYTPVTGLTASLGQISDIGITTSSNYRDRGKLVINETKLREAIANDPMAIYDLFNKEVKDASGNLVTSESGIATRLRASIKSTIANVEAKAGNSYRTYSQYTMGMELNNVDKSIQRMEDRLVRLENRYWQQFTAMEKALQRSNEQSAYLMQQFSSM